MLLNYIVRSFCIAIFMLLHALSTVRAWLDRPRGLVSRYSWIAIPELDLIPPTHVSYPCKPSPWPLLFQEFFPVVYIIGAAFARLERGYDSARHLGCSVKVRGCHPTRAGFLFYAIRERVVYQCVIIVASCFCWSSLLPCS